MVALIQKCIFNILCCQNARFDNLQKFLWFFVYEQWGLNTSKYRIFKILQ